MSFCKNNQCVIFLVKTHPCTKYFFMKYKTKHGLDFEYKRCCVFPVFRSVYICNMSETPFKTIDKMSDRQNRKALYLCHPFNMLMQNLVGQAKPNLLNDSSNINLF